MDLGIRLAGVDLEHPIMNAAGTCKTIDDVERFARSTVAAIVIGSITLDGRMGNQGQVYWREPGYSLNSFGMPNRGGEYYREQLPQMVEIAHAAAKPVILSVAGFTPSEFELLAHVANDGGVDIVELNLGCPNVWNDGQQKRIASFDPPGITAIVNLAAQAAGDRPIGVKLSPYSDPRMLTEVADTLGALPVHYVATSNTFPNSLVLNEQGRSVIDVGLAGLSGAAMKPVVLGQVQQLRQLLPASIQLVGVGGVSTGRDVWEYLHVGASAVQAATAYWNTDNNAGVFGDILSGYIDQLTRND